MKPSAKYLPAFALAFTCIALAPNLTSAQKSASESLAKLSKVPPEQRRQALIEGAKAEKEVTCDSGEPGQPPPTSTNSFPLGFDIRLIKLPSRRKLSCVKLSVE